MHFEFQFCFFLDKSSNFIRLVSMHHSYMRNFSTHLNSYLNYTNLSDKSSIISIKKITKVSSFIIKSFLSFFAKKSRQMSVLLFYSYKIPEFAALIFFNLLLAALSIAI